MKIRSNWLILLLCPAALLVLGGWSRVNQLMQWLPPDTAPARQELQSTIVAPIHEARGATARIIPATPGGPDVMFSTEVTPDAVYLLFRNAVGTAFPLNAAGTTIIKRWRSDGSFAQTKIFLRDDSDSYLRLVPKGARSELEVVLLGRMLYKGILLPVAYEHLLTAPLSTFVELTERRVRWDLVLYQPASGQPTRTREVAAAIRASLPDLGDADDGAWDADGRLVYIKDGSPQPGSGGFNCSGFAKWVVDGFYYPLRGRYSQIEELKARQLTQRGTGLSGLFEEARDPYFGLDWSRNLPRVLAEARRSNLGDPVPRLDPQFADVRTVEFFSYREDVGYRIADLELVLYLLAIEHPQSFFLVSVNTEFGSEPMLRQHLHVGVLFPYFDAAGRFRTDVYERSVDSDLRNLRARYPGGYAHLTRIDAVGDFYHSVPTT